MINSIFLLCMPEPVVGNIYILLAAAAVVGMKKLLAWSFPILTKLPAGVGLLWFAVRGEGWRVLQAAGALSLIVVVSCLLDPRQWHAWVRCWLIAPARALACPALWGPAPLTMLAAIPWLTRLPGQDVERSFIAGQSD